MHVSRLLGLVAAAAGMLSFAGTALANHPVLVEGNCVNPPAGNPLVDSATGILPPIPGTCGDYDGDGRIGIAEDTDGDRVFGTITAALGPGAVLRNGVVTAMGANQNGSVTIVTSGVFSEAVLITAANGNVTLHAAPGVEANIDAVLQGDPRSAARQNEPGIVVDAPADRRVTIRNVTTRNWTEGVRIQGASHATLIGVRAENNANHGIRVLGDAKVTVSRAEVQATGFRVGVGSDLPRGTAPSPGDGIAFEGNASGAVCSSTVSANFRAGIANDGKGAVIAYHNEAFDNDPDVAGQVKVRDDCVDERRGKGSDDAFVPLPADPLDGLLVLAGLILLVAAALLLMRRGRSSVPA